MPKKAYLVEHYDSNELKQKYLKSKDPVESRRWHLLWKVSLGWTIKNSANAVGINYDYAKLIVRKYNESGEETVKNCRKKPRKKIEFKTNYTKGDKYQSTGKKLQYSSAK